MLTTAAPLKAAPVLRMRGMGLRLCIGPNAFGNALGNSLADSIGGPSQSELALQQREDARDAEMTRMLGGTSAVNEVALSSATEQRVRNGQTMLDFADNVDGGYEDGQLYARNAGRPGRDVLRMGPTHEEQLRENIANLSDQLNQRTVGEASAFGQDLRPTVANAARLGLLNSDGYPVQPNEGFGITIPLSPTVAAVASGVGSGLQNLLVGGMEPVLQVVDIFQAGVKGLHGAVTGDVPNLSPLSMMGNELEATGGGTLQGLNIAGRNAIGLIPPVAAWQVGSSLGAALYNGDAAGIAESAVGFGAVFGGSYAAGLNRYGFTVQDVGNAGALGQRGAIGLKFGALDSDIVYSKLSQSGGLAATEGGQVIRFDGQLSNPTRPLAKHGPDVTDPYIYGRVANELSSNNRTGLRTAFNERAQMEAAINETFTLKQPEINAWIGANPRAGVPKAFEADPGLGNLGRGYEVMTKGGPIVPIARPMPNVNLVLIPDGKGSFLIHTAHPF